MRIAALEEIRRAVEAAPAYEVGYPEDVVGPEFAEIARINFLGSRDGTLPARPLLENAMALARADVERLGLVEAALKGPAEAEAAMRQAAELVADKVREILDSSATLEPNADSTIAAKGTDWPLRSPASKGEDRFARLLTVRRAPGDRAPGDPPPETSR